MSGYSSEINVSAFSVFSIIALLLQIPVLAIYARPPRPNIPISFIAFWFAYYNLHSIIGMLAWNDDDFSSWWSGKGWCDIDVRLLAACQTGIFCAHIAVIINLIRIFTHKAIRATQSRRDVYVDLAICLVAPLSQVALLTPVTLARYGVTQYLGCTPMVDNSVVYIIFIASWPPIFGTVAPILLVVLLRRMYSRGREASKEAVSFGAQYTFSHVIRLLSMAALTCLVLTPLSWYVSIVNFTGIAQQGVTAPAWAHGKPENWEEPVVMPYYFPDQNGNNIGSETFGTPAWTVSVSTLVLSFVAFLFYGTGSLAQQFYHDVAITLRIPVLAEKLHLQKSSGNDDTHWRSRATATGDERYIEYLSSPREKGSSVGSYKSMTHVQETRLSSATSSIG